MPFDFSLIKIINCVVNIFIRCYELILNKYCVCLFTRKSIITTKSPKADFYFLQTKVHYDKSFELYHKIKCPLESLEVLVKMIILDMRFINGIIGMYYVLGCYDD